MDEEGVFTLAWAASRSVRLGVGVIGLGRLWEARHKPAFARMGDRFRVAAVYDQVARRAATEASQVGCAASDGLMALIERPDVDAVYLLSPQWFGLHPLELAAGLGKPVYCAPTLAGSPDEVTALAAAIRQGGAPFMPELARRFYPATLRLRELLATTLGKPRLVLGQNRLFGVDRYGEPGPSTLLAPAPLTLDPGAFLLDWCRFISQDEPVGLHAFGASVLEENDFEGFAAEFAGGDAGPDQFRPPPPGPLGQRPPCPAGLGIPGVRRARDRLARNARPHPLGRRPRDARRDIARSAGRRRGPQRPVPSPRQRRAFPGADAR